MATFTVNDSSYSWDVGDLQTYRIYNASASTVNSNVVVLNGTNYAGQSFTATVTGSFSVFGTSVYGSVNGITFTIGGSQVYSATGMDVSFSTYSGSSNSSFTSAATSGNDLFSINSTRGSTWSLGAGNDTINSGSGNDYIYGGSGTDRLIVDGNYGGASFSSSYGYVILDGPDGRDSLDLVELAQFNNLTVALKAGESSADTLNGNTVSASRHDVLLGGGGNDTLNGYSGRDLLNGETGNDLIRGHSGNDTLLGGDGGDTLVGGYDADLLKGGEGNDVLKGNQGNDMLRGGGGNDNLQGQAGKDHLTGDDGDDRLLGGAHNDTLNGGDGRDTLIGGNHDDRILGGNGNDWIHGGDGNDTLMGQGGADTLIGQRGDDLLIGSGGADVFVFHRNYGNDTIGSFAAGQDIIRIGSGASSMSDLDFQRQGDDVLISFDNVTILVEDITVAQLQDSDNFLF
ncbi:calcium-binding protein [Leisingera sp. JC11]|uniref:calcium-binding protein n=1 Tax=Leisingera sp. JC11 TaxID=3042469 RepID=UPI003455BC14